MTAPLIPPLEGPSTPALRSATKLGDDQRLSALRAAIAEGEQSGPPVEFSMEEFVQQRVQSGNAR